MRKFEVVKDEFIQYGVKDIKMPFRATEHSAGYDLFSPIDVIIPPHKIQLIWTNIKAIFEQDEMLMLLVTSKMGKNYIMLANSVGIVESDYYSNENNDGNLGLMLYNSGDNDYVIKKGDKIGQGIFTKFLIIDNEEKKGGKRTGGFGSTLKNK